MLEKKTEELNAILENTSPKELGAYLKDNRDYLATSDRPFYNYFSEVVDAKGIKLKDVYSFAGTSESYGGQIVRMEKRTANRDLIIRFCVAGHFTVTETNRALKLYGMSELYSKDPRDACITVAVHNRKYDLGEIDDILEAQGFEKLSAEEK